MRNLLFTVLLTLAAIAANAQARLFSKFKATYYVSQDGNDSNSGRYPWAPWKTIDRVNAATINPGDIIAFRCGDEFTGSLVVMGTGNIERRTTYTSYGYGDKPKFTGRYQLMAGYNIREIFTKLRLQLT